MDQATQQNAALVEQMAAAASSLKTQAGEMVETVAVFKIGGNESIFKAKARSPASMSTSFKGSERRITETVSAKRKSLPAKPPAARPAQLPKTVTTAKEPSGGDDEWETF
jgi:hypothetical protein